MAENRPLNRSQRWWRFAPLVWAGAMVVSLLIAAAPVAAQQPQPGIKMEANAAFGGAFKYGEWLAVWALVENSGPDVEAEVRVHVASTSGAATFAAQVSLPTGSRKRVPVYVLPNNFARTLEVQLVDVEGQVIASQKVDVKPIANINFVMGLVAPERGALALVSGANAAGVSRSKMLIDVSLGELPDRLEGLRTLDCLVLNDVDTSLLTPAQGQALAAWVEQGGWLVIGGGAGSMRTASGLPESLLPVVPRQEVTLQSLPGLTELGGGEEVRVPGPFLASVGDQSEGQTLAEQDEIVLLRERRVGDGVVDYCALDLSASPFDAWAGTFDFWGRLLAAHGAYPANLPPDVSPRQMVSEQMNYALSNLPSLSLPSVQWVAVLLGVYVLLVGPINYIILRRRKRLQLAWITIPAITLLFSGGAFGLAYAMRGTDLIVNKIAVVTAAPDRAAQVNVYVGLFSPARQSYEIEVEGTGLLSSLNQNYNPFSPMNPGSAGNVMFVQGTPGRVRGLSVNQWSMQTFMTEDVWPSFGGVSSDLSFKDEELVGTVRNETDQVLRDAVVVFNQEFVRLGNIEAGQEAQVQIDMRSTNPEMFGPPISYRLFEEAFQQSGGAQREVRLKQQILDSVFNSGSFGGAFSQISSKIPGGSGDALGLMFLGWFDRSPPQVRVDGRAPVEMTTALLLAPLNYHLPESGPISVPVGFMPGSIVETPDEGGQCGPPGIPAIWVGRGHATLQFQLPGNMEDVQVDALTLQIRVDGGWVELPEISLYDWTSDEWRLLEAPALGENRIEEAKDLVSRAGEVLVRVSSANGGGCFYMQMGFEGRR